MFSLLKVTTEKPPKGNEQGSGYYQNNIRSKAKALRSEALANNNLALPLVILHEISQNLHNL